MRQNGWLQPVGTPPHFRREIHEHLNNVFSNRWIGRNGLNSWPAHSPDLTHCEFFLKGYSEQLTYNDGGVNTVKEFNSNYQYKVYATV